MPSPGTAYGVTMSSFDPGVVIDLHTHSDRSDGTESPELVVRRAAEAGVDVVALTDHDVISGWAEADAAGREHGVCVVPGIEVSCSFEGASVHLLAYLPDPSHSGLMTELETARAGRDARLRTMVELIGEAGYPVTYDEVLAQAGPEATLGRPHIADVLVRKGVFDDRDGAFRELLSTGSPYYVSYRVLDPVRMTELIVAAGGVPVIAHPFSTRHGRVAPVRLIEEMTEAGLVGIEVDHHDHGAQERALAASVASDLGLLATGSSDYHGAGKVNVLAEHTTAPEVFRAIVDRASGTGLLGAAQRAG